MQNNIKISYAVIAYPAFFIFFSNTTLHMYSNLSLQKACSLVFQKLINIPLKINELPFALETLHNDVTNEQQAWFRCVSV